MFEFSPDTGIPTQQAMARRVEITSVQEKMPSRGKPIAKVYERTRCPPADGLPNRSKLPDDFLDRRPRHRRLAQHPPDQIPQSSRRCVQATHGRVLEQMQGHQLLRLLRDER